MFGWSFAAANVDEVVSLLGAMARHRYLQEVDHRLHWVVDAALAPLDPQFDRAHQRHKALRNEHPELDPHSRDPRLWRAVSMAEVEAVLHHFWLPERQARAAQALLTAQAEAGFSLPQHPPFASPPDEPPHPELLLLDWVFLAVDQLDTERHAGALRAMEDSGEEINPSEPIYVEGPTLSSAELCAGAPGGNLVAPPMFWAAGPYRYIEYVFRGVRRGAKLAEPPIGYRDIDTL